MDLPLDGGFSDTNIDKLISEMGYFLREDLFNHLSGGREQSGEGYSIVGYSYK